MVEWLRKSQDTGRLGNSKNQKRINKKIHSIGF
jgi:hypothetical protein